MKKEESSCFLFLLSSAVAVLVTDVPGDRGKRRGDLLAERSKTAGGLAK